MPTSLTKSQTTTGITGDEIWQENSSIEEICDLMSVLENLVKLETSAVTTNNLEIKKTPIYQSTKQKIDNINHSKTDIETAHKEIKALLNERTKYTNKIIKNWCFKKKKALYISLTTKLDEQSINFTNIFYNKENLIDDIAKGPIKKLTLNEVNKIDEYKLKQPSSFKENLFKNYLKAYIKTSQYAKTKKHFTALENFNGKENFKYISEYKNTYEPIDIIEILIESISISNLINKNPLNEVKKPGHFNCRKESNKIYFEILEDYSKIKNMVKKMESLIKKDQPKEIKLTIEKYLISQGLLGVSSEDIESIGLQDYADHLADLIKIKKTITQKNYRKNDHKIQKSFKIHSLIYNRILHYSQPVSTTDIINSSFKNIINRENDAIKNIIRNSTITKQSLHSNNKINLMNISARINKDTNEKLKRIAKKHNLTERELINHAVLFWLNSDPLMAIQRPINPKARSRNDSSKTLQQSI